MITLRWMMGVAVCAALAGAQQAQQAPEKPKPGIAALKVPTARIVPDAQYDIGGGPDWLIAGEDQMWTNAKRQDFVARMDPASSKVVARVKVTKPCSGLTIGAGSLWAPSCEENVIYRISTKTNELEAKVPVAPANTEGGIAFGAGSVWMPTDPKGTELARIDPATNQVTQRIAMPPGSLTAVFGYGLVWVSSTETSVVSAVHPATNKIIATVPVDKNPRFLAVGEGYVWTLNQATGTVSKIDPNTMKAVATIEVGVPGLGGDIAAGEGSVWVTARTIPVSRIDPLTNKVIQQFAGPGGDAIKVGHGSVWLSNGRWGHVWRMTPAKLSDLVPASWTAKAQKADLDGDGKPDLLVEDLAVWLPGEPVKFRMRRLNPAIAGPFVLSASNNGKAAKVPFEAEGKDMVATYSGAEPRWIHYSVCAGQGMCSPDLVTASPTTPVEYAKAQARLVPADFLLPTMPELPGLVWNILQPSILDPDYQALVDRAGSSGPIKITKAEDYGELKRHEWEFQNQTAYSWGVLTADKTQELGCVYINPSKTAGYDAQVRIWVTRQGEAAGLEPKLVAAVQEWVKTKWPFRRVVYPGRLPGERHKVGGLGRLGSEPRIPPSEYLIQLVVQHLGAGL